MLQRVLQCVLQWVAVCCSVLQCVNRRMSLLHSTQVYVCCNACCSVLQCSVACCSVFKCRMLSSHSTQWLCVEIYVAVCCNVLQCVAVCNTLQRHATHCNTLQHTPTHTPTNTTIQSLKVLATIQMQDRDASSPDAATHCNTLQHTATHTTIQSVKDLASIRMLDRDSSSPDAATCCHTLQHTATRCNTVSQRFSEHADAWSRCIISWRCNTLQLTLQHTMQHTTTHTATQSLKDLASMRMRDRDSSSPAQHYSSSSYRNGVEVLSASSPALISTNFSRAGNELQCVAVCCSVFQRVAVCCNPCHDLLYFPRIPPALVMCRDICVVTYASRLYESCRMDDSWLITYLRVMSRMYESLNAWLVHITYACHTVKSKKCWNKSTHVETSALFKYFDEQCCFVLVVFWVSEFSVFVRLRRQRSRTAIRCDTLEHADTHCSTLQRRARHCNTLQRSVSPCNTPPHPATCSNTQPQSVTNCKTL